MTNFYPKMDGKVATADFECFPKELGNSWIFIHKFENHPLYSYLFSLYHNNDFEKGTVVMSPYIYHKYPDIYSVYAKPQKDDIHYGIRVNVNPKFRGRGWWTWYGYLTRVIFWGTFGIHVDSTQERNTKIENFYQKATNAIGQNWKTENSGRNNYPDEEMPRDPAFPYIWYNNRIGGKNEV